MGILRNMNFRRHTRTLRTLDYENMPPEHMVETPSDASGRPADQLYEGASGLARKDATGVDEQKTHLPQPDAKPDPRAQWDDIAGRWIIWDDEAGDWVPIED